MARRKLDIKKNAYIQVPITPEDKRAFDVWCSSNGTTMSEVIRKEIASYVSKGKKLLGGGE